MFSEKVTAAAYNQSIVFHSLRKSKHASVNQRYDKNTKNDFEDIDEEPLVPIEKIISELLTCKNSTTVQREEDITLRDSGAISSNIDNELAFDNILFGDHKDFYEEPLENWDFADICTNTSTAEDTTYIPISSVVRENLMLREGEICKERLECPSIPILEMSVGNTSNSHLTRTNDCTDDHLLVIDQSSNTSIANRDHTGYRSLTGDNLEQLDSQILISTLAVRKRKGAKHLIIDKKTKLEAETMKHAMENSENTQRCQDPREDITPIQIVRYPLDVTTTIFKHPARITGSSFLTYLFKRNTRKRPAEIEDLLTDEWLESLQILTKENNETMNFLKLRKIQPRKEKSASPLNQTQPQHCDVQQLMNSELQLNISSNRSLETALNSINVQDKIEEFCEDNLLKLLENLWCSKPDSISFKTLENYCHNKLDAVRCFSLILVLVAKRKLEITRTGSNQISSIKRGSDI